jgi:aryl-alcohol dehydrogenase-like predicted oxidoreductase
MPASKITGFATPEGTKRFAKRLGKKANPEFYTEIEGLTLSTLGIGTYLGESDENDDQLLSLALKESILGGINVIDTAANYRDQRSERVIGQVLKELIEADKIQRDEIFVSTKGGFIPFDGVTPSDPSAYFRDRFIKTKILTPQDVVAGCHSLAPTYINDQFEQSRRNLGLETIDLYFLHNPETQLEEYSHGELIHRLHRAFVVLETKVKAGQLKFSGTATWNAYRVPETSRELLNLSEVVDAASDHGAAKSFKFIQLPFNLALPEALTLKNQKGKCVLAKALELGLHVMTSASIMQAKILGKLPKQLDFLAPGEPDAIKALNYARSSPGVDIALCGMKRLEHVHENLKLAHVPKVNEEALSKMMR